MFLGKAELFLALAAAPLAGLILATWSQSTLKERVTAWTAFLGGICTTILAAWLLLSFTMPPMQVL